MMNRITDTEKRNVLVRKQYSRILKLFSRQYFKYFELFLIFGSIVAIILSSFGEIPPLYRLLLFAFTYLVSFIFLVEYIFRILAAPAEYPGKNAFKARMSYLFSFFGFVDFVAILPFLLVYLFWGTSFLHLIILAHVFIIFKLIRYSNAFAIIGRALKEAKDELIAAYTVCGIMICISAILMFYIENEAQPQAFANIGSSLWWAIVTFTTVGYGDIYPVTVLGKMLGGVISLVGIGMIALPTGIISSAFMNVLQERKKEKLK